MRRLGGWAAVFLTTIVLLAGCGEGGPDERSSATEETKFVTQMVTVAESAPSEATQKVTVEESAPSDISEDADVSQEQAPEDVLALQYEYINRGDFEKAYSLFAEQSQQEVSLAQYRAFFEANAPYSVTNYSFLSVQTQGDSATIEAAFTVTSASGVEQLQRTQQLVRESGDWRVVMRAEQLAAFTATGSVGGTKPAPKKESPAPKKNQEKRKGEAETVTIRVTGPAGEEFSGNYGDIDSQRSVDGSVPAEYDVEIETGVLSFDSVTAVMQKRSPGPWELSLQFVVDGEIVKEESTTAEFGVISLNYTP